MIHRKPDNIRGHPGPSFLFIGPSKAGSSWFFEILREHPQVFVPSNKATFFFTDYYTQGIDWYEKFFSGTSHGRTMGEVCHDYLASPEALRRIRKYRPGMRLVCCLRNPYSRALSSWRFFGRNGMDQPTLAAQGEHTPSVFDQGNYATQLALVNSLFPRHQLLIFFFEELVSAPESVVRRLYEFIGVDATFVPASLYKRVNVNAKPRSRPLARLVQYIHEQSWKRSRNLSNFIGRLKRIRLLRRLVRYTLYKEPQSSTDWSEYLWQFPEHVVSRYESEISALEKMLGRDLAEWHALPVDRANRRPMNSSGFKKPAIVVNGSAAAARIELPDYDRSGEVSEIRARPKSNGYKPMEK
jgi:Sulfotransferase domain